MVENPRSGVGGAGLIIKDDNWAPIGAVATEFPRGTLDVTDDGATVVVEVLVGPDPVLILSCEGVRDVLPMGVEILGPCGALFGTKMMSSTPTTIRRTEAIHHPLRVVDRLPVLLLLLVTEDFRLSPVLGATTTLGPGQTQQTHQDQESTKFKHHATFSRSSRSTQSRPWRTHGDLGRWDLRRADRDDD